MGNEVDIHVKTIDDSKGGIEGAQKRVHAFGNVAVTSGGKIKSAMGFAGKGIAGLAIGATGLAAVAGPKLLDMGVKIEAMGNKARTVFGGSLPIVQKWADVASVKMGLTSKEAQGMAASLGDLLTPMGFTQKQAAQMSTKISDLSGAFAQWSNGTLSTSDASNMLSDALTGEYDSLKSVGVQLDADTVKALLHKAGKDKLTGAALKQATAEVVLKEVTRQSSNAISAYTGGTNKLAIAKNKLTSQVNTLKERFVTALIPAMSKAAEWAGQHLPGAAANTIHAFGNIGHAAGNTIHALGNLFHALGNVWHALGNVWHAGENVAHALGNVGHAAGNIIHAGGNVVHAIGNIGHAFGNVGRAISGAASAMWNFVKGGQELVPIGGLIVDTINKVQNAGGGGGGAKNKATFAHGGIVGAASGGLRGNFVEVGEHGREIVKLPGGSHVYSNDQSKAMMASGGGGTMTHVVRLVVEGSNRDFVNFVRRSFRDVGITTLA